MRRPRLAWSLFALAAVLIPASVVLQMIVSEDGASIHLVFSLCFAAVQFSTAGVGAVVASRIPGNAVGWILLAIGVGLGIRQSLGAYGELGLTTEHGPLPGDDVAAWLGGWIFVPVVAGGVIFLLHLFPDGRFMSRRWRLVGRVTGAIVLLVAAGDALKAGRLESVSTDERSFDNPFAATGAIADLVGVVQAVVGPLVLVAFGLSAAGIVVRLRRSKGVEREQIKWIACTLTLVAVGLAGSAALPASVQFVALLFALLALAAMPVAAGVAILRYRLYDIDVIINRTLVYGALTAMLAGTYLGSVLLLQLVLSAITAGSGLAVAGSTLAVAGLFTPARVRIQAIVDRRFYRSKYDAERTLERFGARLRHEIDIDALGGELRAVVHETMQPQHVTLWLRGR